MNRKSILNDDKTTSTPPVSNHFKNNIICLMKIEKEFDSSEFVADLRKVFRSQGHTSTVFLNKLVPSRESTPDIVQVGSWIPRSLWGYFSPLFYVVRSMYTAIKCLNFLRNTQVVLVVVDASSLSLPLLRLCGCNNIIYMQYFEEFLANTTSAPMYGPLQSRNFIRHWCVSWASEIIVPAKRAKKALHSTVSLYDKNITIIYPPTNCEKVSTFNTLSYRRVTRISFTSNDDNIVFLTSGTMDSKSNFDIIIFSFGKLLDEVPPEWKSRLVLDILADVNYELKAQRSYMSLIQNMVNTAPFNNQINLLTNVDTAKKCMYIAACNVMINMTEDDNFNWSVIESQYFGRPIITTSSGFASEIILNRINGFFVMKTVTEIVGAMRYQITEYGKRIETVSKNAVILYDTTLSQKVFTKKLNDLVLKYILKDSQLNEDEFNLKALKEKEETIFKNTKYFSVKHLSVHTMSFQYIPEARRDGISSISTLINSRNRLSTVSELIMPLAMLTAKLDVLAKTASAMTSNMNEEADDKNNEPAN